MSSLDAFCSPQTVLPGHLLDQSDGLAAYPGAPAPAAGHEAPEQPEALRVPAQEHVELEDQKGLLPTAAHAGG